jgi:hypothetical protein
MAMNPGLHEVLTRFAPNLIGLGDNFDPKGLRRALDGLLTNLRRMYWITATMVGVVFCIEISVAVMFSQNPAVLVGLAAAIGVTIWGAVDRMGRLAQEMAKTNLVVILADRLTSEMLERIVQSLVDPPPRRSKATGRA